MIFVGIDFAFSYPYVDISDFFPDLNDCSPKTAKTLWAMIDNINKGKDDLYSFNLPDILFSLVVEVTNKETNEPVPGVTITLTGSDGSQVVKTTDAEGVIMFEEENKKRFILKETDYKIEASRDEFLKASHEFSTIGREKSVKFFEQVI